jgi:hypothetical protein
VFSDEFRKSSVGSHQLEVGPNLGNVSVEHLGRRRGGTASGKEREDASIFATRGLKETDGDDEIRFGKNLEVMGNEDTSLLGERSSGEAVDEEFGDVSVDSGKLRKNRQVVSDEEERRRARDEALTGSSRRAISALAYTARARTTRAGEGKRKRGSRGGEHDVFRGSGRDFEDGAHPSDHLTS